MERFGVRLAEGGADFGRGAEELVVHGRVGRRLTGVARGGEVPTLRLWPRRAERDFGTDRCFRGRVRVVQSELCDLGLG